MEERVAFTADDGMELVGTLAQPASSGPHPAALLLNGSGPLDRDSNMPGQTLDVAPAFASAFAKHGVASLRYDKRGVGESSGEYLMTSFDRETDDADSALVALKSSGVDPARVTIVGHSVGATIAIRLSARHEWLAGAVLLGGASSPGAEVMRWQSERIAASLRGLERLGARRFLRRQAEVRQALLESEGDTVDVEGGHPARWFREYMAYDPARDLAAIACPVLAITGGKDLQVDPDDVDRIGEHVCASFTGQTPENLTHILRTHSGRSTMSSYRAQLRRPVAAELLESVASWVAAR